MATQRLTQVAGLSEAQPNQQSAVHAQVVIDALVKEYDNLRALGGVSFSVNCGEWVALMGPSGSGKTTLINILGGLDTLTSGCVSVDGVDLAKLTENELVRYRAEKVGFVFQQFHLVPYLNALENVMLAQYFHSSTDERQAAEALRRVGLGDRLEHLPAKLSGGEQQRVAIARALINQPKLILADEPTGNLDEANETKVLEIFRELHQAGHTILMVTHDPDIARQADRRIELAHGHLQFDSAQHGPGHPLHCPLANTPDCCTEPASVTTAEDQVRFDHLLEQIWICDEAARPAQISKLRSEGPAGRLPLITDEPARRVLARMSDVALVELRSDEARLTPMGARRARDVVRRHRLAERLFKDTFSIDDTEAHTQACKFEHIISPELDARICAFLGHPTTCPHGNPIPPGACCQNSANGGRSKPSDNNGHD
ncbi:MAG TPA: ATP-binding cassette domain-containing protein [Candidatus Acidoferrum sp.]|nr:ATP-binding cassette domain-containing protein [Candidatus Acidoferrum sp.]